MFFFVQEQDGAETVENPREGTAERKQTLNNKETKDSEDTGPQLVRRENSRVFWVLPIKAQLRSDDFEQEELCRPNEQPGSCPSLHKS